MEHFLFLPIFPSTIFASTIIYSELRPSYLLVGLDRANVGVGSEQDVLSLGFLLVDPLHTESLVGLARHLAGQS